MTLVAILAKGIFGSVPDPWRFGPDPDPDPYQWLSYPDPALFFKGFPEGQQKISVFYNVFLLISYRTVVTFTSVFKDNKLLTSQKTLKIKVFSKFFAC
jgi:hypothetical protein